MQVGTIIVNRNEGKILGRGHNRMPNGCDKLPWNDDYHDLLNSKYPYGKTATSMYAAICMSNKYFLCSIPQFKGCSKGCLQEKQGLGRSYHLHHSIPSQHGRTVDCRMWNQGVSLLRKPLPTKDICCCS